MRVRVFSYKRNVSDLPYLINLLNFKISAALAFNTIVDIDPSNELLEIYLIQLFEDTFNNDWKFDLMFLLRYASRAQQNIIQNVVHYFSDSDEEHRDRLTEELNKKKWSKDWIKYLE